ncbi:MAG: DUF721 domain-containing protein [Bacteroidota bacterium]|nr:DUF721 domain-containing protein [Bacteroidota bacterium]
MGLSNETTLKAAIEKYIEVYQLRGKFDENKIRNIWNEVVGEQIGKRTTSISLDKKKLKVKLDSSVAKQELLFMRTRIINVINRKAGKKIVAEIVVY